MIDAQVAEELAKDLAGKTDARIAVLFTVNALACATTGGKDADTPWARLHKALVEEITRRGLKVNGRLN